jgi:hypothetical protein
MQDAHGTGASANQVTALFAGGALSFSLSKGATFADLAARLNDLGDRHLGMATAISMKFAVHQRAGSVLRSGI